MTLTASKVIEALVDEGVEKFLEEGGLERCREHLKKLARKRNKPFRCPYLVVLPKKIAYRQNERTTVEVPEGTLICWPTVNCHCKPSDIVCKITETKIILSEDGQIEAFCGKTIGIEAVGRFTLSIVSFKTQRT